MSQNKDLWAGVGAGAGAGAGRGSPGGEHLPNIQEPQGSNSSSRTNRKRRMAVCITNSAALYIL
ncbi:rCG61476, partial [Rattus norvegicus]